MTSPAPAAHHLEATLEPHCPRGLRRLLHTGRVAVSVLLATFGVIDPPIFSNLVVRRRDTGAEVLRTRADIGDPELLLAQVRRDLEEKSVAEFAAEWRLDAG
jgi:hypothetical protein